jgi:hypothetical protein
MQNKQRLEYLRKLSPVDAVKAWLDGDFRIGDEPALIEAIRKDTRIRLPDESLMDILLDAMDTDMTPQQCLEKLAAASVIFL